MSEALKKVDWHLLHRQKMVLLALRERQRSGSTEYKALSGIIHLLDALQDEVAENGRWAFPAENEEVNHVKV